MNQHIDSYKHHIETLEGEKDELFKLKPSSIQTMTTIDPSEELENTLYSLNTV